MNQLETLFERAFEDFQDRNFSSALELLGSAEKLIDPGDIENTASVLNFKGFNYLGINELQSAQECFEKALEINPASSQACAGLGEIFFLCEFDIEAKAMYEWALDFNPVNNFAVKGLAKTNTNLGLPETHNTLNLDTTLVKKDSFYSLVGDAYRLFGEKKFEEALDSVRQAELYFPRWSVTRDASQKISSLENFKGFNYLALQNTDNARTSFESALKLNPYSSQASAGLGEVYFLTGNEAESKTMFEFAVKYNEANEFALSGLAKVNKALGYAETHNSLK